MAKAPDMNFKELVNALRELNPTVDIRTCHPAIATSGNRIYSSVSTDRLKMPPGFYYNDKNGMTNKHNSASGMYIGVDVYPIKGNEQLTSVASPARTRGKQRAEALPDPRLYPQYDFSLGGLQKTFDQYEVVGREGKDGQVEHVARRREDGVTNSDPLMVDRAKFASMWARAAKRSGLSFPNPEFDSRANDEVAYKYAFGVMECEYNNLMKAMQWQLRETGNINPQDVCHIVSKMQTRSSRRINAPYLFSSDVFADAATNYFRAATPDAKEQTQRTPVCRVSENEYFQ